MFEILDIENLGIPWSKSRTPLLTTVLVAVLTYLVYKVLAIVRHIVQLHRTFKGANYVKKHWLFGHIRQVGSSHVDRLMWGVKMCDHFPTYYVFWIGPLRATVTVVHSSTAKIVMKTSEPKPTGFAGIYRFGLPWLGKGLLIALGDRWARSRRLLTPAFHFDILKPYIKVYNNATELLLQNLEQSADRETTFEVFRYISACTLDIVLRCAFSYHTDCQNLQGTSHPYVQAVNELSDIWNLRTRKFHWYYDWVFYLTDTGRKFRQHCDYVHKVAEDIIEKRRKVLDSSKPNERKYLDFLDILLTAKDENGVGLTKLQIRNEVDTFLFEGHDTTASAISWVLYELAKHPECQRKCQDEIDALLEDRESDVIEWTDLNKLDYLTMCIKEGMRNYPAVPFIQREMTQDFQLEGKTFPAGTTVSLHIYALHHNKNVWKKPFEFIPERFTRENIAKMDSHQYLPFSAGPRNCIGQNFALNEEKVILSRLLRKYTFEVDPNHAVSVKGSGVLRAENGIMMFARRR